MAENDQERTERPTGKRIEGARQEGRVPRSAEANAAAVLLVAAASLHFLGGSLGAALFDIAKSGLSVTPDPQQRPGEPAEHGPRREPGDLKQQPVT